MQDTQSIPEDQQADKDADQRVKPVQAGKTNDDTSGNCPNGGEDIAQEVNVGTAQVQIMFAATLDQTGGNQIHDNGHRADDDQHIRFDFRRGEQAAIGIIKDGQGNDCQDGGIYQRHQDAGAMVAIGFAGIGWPCGCAQRPPGKRQGQDIGNVMDCVGQQGQGIGKKAGGNLNHHKSGCQADGDSQAADGGTG